MRKTSPGTSGSWDLNLDLSKEHLIEFGMSSTSGLQHPLRQLCHFLPNPRKGTVTKPGCLQESFHYFKYKKSENILYQYADDIAPRHLTAALPLDYDTVAGGDKFGNVFLTRLPADISAQVYPVS